MSIATAIRSIGYGATWPYMSIFFENQLLVPKYLIGIIFTLFSGSSIIFSILGGAITDYFGRKPTLLMGSISGFGFYLTLALLYQFGFPAIIISIIFILSSFSGSLIFPAASTSVADVTESNRRLEAYSIYRILFNIGWAVGPLFGALIYNYGISWIFFVVTLAHLIQFLIISFFFKEPNQTEKKRPKVEEQRFRFFAVDRYLVVFSIGTFLVFIVASQFSVTLPLYAVDIIGINPGDIGYIYLVNGLVVVIGQYPLIRAMRKGSNIHIMNLGAAFYSIGYFLVSLSTTLSHLMIVMIIITIGENLISPGINTVVSKIAPEDRMGRYMGFISMFNAIGSAMGPAIGAIYMEIFKSNGLVMWSNIILFGLLGIVFFLIFSKMVKAKTSNRTI